MKKILNRLNIKDTELFIIFCLSLMLNIVYLEWRLLYTIDYSTGAVNLIWPLLLFAAEFYSFAVFFMFSIATLNVRKIDYSVPPKDITYFPGVDIFICTYNESQELLRNTAVGCKNIRYKDNNEEKEKLRDSIARCKSIKYENKKVYLLDDGHRNEIKQLAEELEIHYISRENNIGFKAGNINNALKQTDGDFIVVFDADHIPVSTFLTELIDNFKDEKVALVQTPQYFFNPDPFQKNLGLIKQLTNEQELFFRVIQPGLAQWNSVICCGTNFIVRRKALDEIGGFPVNTITEDMDLGMRLQAKGFLVKYYSKPLAAGLSAESFQQYINQRMRWCAGNLQAYIFNIKGSFKELSFMQKCFYTSGISYYFFGVPRIIFLVSPMLYLLFGVKPLFAYWLYVAFFVIAGYSLKILAFSKVAGKHRHFLITDVYETAVAFFMSFTVIKTFINPHNIKFKITAKNVKETDTNYLLALPLFVLLIGSIASFAVPFMHIYRYIFSLEALALNLILNLYNMIILILSINVVFEKLDKRKEQRIPIALETSIENETKGKIDIEIVDLSKKGALLFARRDKSDEFESIFNDNNNLILPNEERVKIKALRSRKKGKGRYYNVKFDFTLEEKETEKSDEILKIAFNDSNNWK